VFPKKLAVLGNVFIVETGYAQIKQNIQDH
jgi:hypothetical protein